MSPSNSGNPPLAKALLGFCLLSLGFHLVAESLDAPPVGVPTAAAAEAPCPGHDPADDPCRPLGRI